MSKWSKTNLPCPCGQSSDAFAKDHEDKGFCFSCWKPFRNNKEVLSEEDREDQYLQDDGKNYEFNYYAHRGISLKTFEFFNVKTKFEDSKPIEAAFQLSNGSLMIRDLYDKKKISVKGEIAKAPVFGINHFDKGSKRCVTLTEGFYDTLASYEIVGNESVVLGIRSASSAKSDVMLAYDYINSFDKIIINFDNDAPGQVAAKRVASLFDFKKVFNLSLDRYKDSNDYIWDQDKSEARDERRAYYDAWRGVKRYTPDNIISGNSSFRERLKDNREASIGDYPFKTLQEKLYGMHRGEVVLIKAPRGAGKTELFRAIQDHLLKTTKSPIGIIHLEEDPGTTLKGMAAYYSNEPVHMPHSYASEDQVMKIIEDINGPREDRFFLRDAFDVEDEDAFVDNIRFLVSGCGCDFVFLDHISWLATGSDDQDERKKLDRISQRLKLLAKELRFCLIMISHVNDDGKTRGSRNIENVANTIIKIYRDVENPDEAERNKTHMIIEKARLIGATTGPADYAVYDEDLCLLKDIYRGGTTIELP